MGMAEDERRLPEHRPAELGERVDGSESGN